MEEVKLTIETVHAVPESTFEDAQSSGKLKWETPKLEDVSEQVMAQPYIRFT